MKSLTTGQTTSITASIDVAPAAEPLPVDGPKVMAVQRYGIHMLPTTIVLTFDQPLDPTRAQDVHLYHLVDLQGHKVPIKSAVYHPATMTVTLHPSRRINLHHSYKLTVEGSTPTGLTDIHGLLLDGKASGHPGTDYVTTINFDNLVLPPNWNPKWSAQFTHHKAHPAARKAGHAIVTGHHHPFRRSWSFPSQRPPKGTAAETASRAAAQPRHFAH